MLIAGYVIVVPLFVIAVLGLVGGVLSGMSWCVWTIWWDAGPEVQSWGWEWGRATGMALLAGLFAAIISFPIIGLINEVEETNSREAKQRGIDNAQQEAIAKRNAAAAARTPEQNEAIDRIIRESRATRSGSGNPFGEAANVPKPPTYTADHAHAESTGSDNDEE